MKMSFICKRMKTQFHMKGFAPSLTLKQRLKATQKWLIYVTHHHSSTIQNSPLASLVFGIKCKLTGVMMYIFYADINAQINTPINVPRRYKLCRQFSGVCLQHSNPMQFANIFLHPVQSMNFGANISIHFK